MPLAISTHWNAYKHSSGETLVEEVLNLGFNHIELGYDLRADLAPGIKNMAQQNAVKITSLHNFCPVPVGAPFGHPELFELTSPSPGERENAIQLTLKTADFAASMNVKNVVIHCGNMKMRPTTRKLIQLCESNKQHSPKFARLKNKLILRRDKHIQKYIDNLYRSLEKMLPALKDINVSLCIENLPSGEAVPSCQEIEKIINHFDSPFIRHWHDTGHSRIMHNLGFIDQIYWIKKLHPVTAGMHIHDVKFPASDHIMPPLGDFDFTLLEPFVKNDKVLVLEPASIMTPEDVLTGKNMIKKALRI